MRGTKGLFGSWPCIIALETEEEDRFFHMGFSYGIFIWYFKRSGIGGVESTEGKNKVEHIILS